MLGLCYSLLYIYIHDNYRQLLAEERERGDGREKERRKRDMGSREREWEREGE